MQQGTVARRVHFCGVGLHSGKVVELVVMPAEVNSGIVFHRTDIQFKENKVQAIPKNVIDTRLSTTIGNTHCKVATIEHLMAAFSGLGIDNAQVQISAEEVPILDGSSAPFVDKLVEVGVQRQPKSRKVLIPTQTIEVSQRDQSIRLDPPTTQCYREFSPPVLRIHYTIDFSCSEAIGKQSRSIQFNSSTFLELCEARTFCHQRDVEHMRSQGLALGGSLDNAIVVSDSGIMNEEGLRYSDEFVRHKILDCVGDLALLGGGLAGNLKAHKAGHYLHNKLVDRLMQTGMTIEWDPTQIPNEGLTKDSSLYPSPTATG
ncbi:MAG: UDP-3-O-acyl-N-acetylglucosamine deacetylase [Zetaproteobacteria bacterium]|nr:UDP-3-O-acyl-N-acetylglucosamine deacetylase [Zetaproteobacteria bacterium]